VPSPPRQLRPGGGRPVRGLWYSLKVCAVERDEPGNLVANINTLKFARYLVSVAEMALLACDKKNLVTFETDKLQKFGDVLKEEFHTDQHRGA
jgi:hypothetical protein